MEKINKVRNSLIVVIVIILIATTCTLLFATLWKNSQAKMYTSLYTPREGWKYPCLSKGKVCSEEDIVRAIKVKIPVNEKEIYDFYLLSNDENTATYIMASNIAEKVDWNIEKINIKGPYSAYAKLNELTDDWTYVPYIESYHYDDEGYTFYQELCKRDFTTEEIYYDCSSDLVPTRGYKGIDIEDGVTTIHYNMPENEELVITEKVQLAKKARARMIKLEEIEKFVYDYDQPDWLIDHVYENGGYWTMSSSTFPSSQYMQGAFAVVINENKTDIAELYSKQEYNDYYTNIGIRPVITISKE